VHGSGSGTGGSLEEHRQAGQALGGKLPYAEELDERAARLEANALDDYAQVPEKPADTHEPQQAEEQHTPTSASSSSEPKTKA
jgi:hypothetical protein